jgi:metal-dependent amidase/aminoacylase/carboxypeptidase family protein
MTAFLSSHGFEVTHHYLLPTAWRATFTHHLPSADGSRQLRTIGINSEMDALPGIGHACGHNLIAIAGVAVACAVKAAMEEWDIEGKVELLGTPGASDSAALKTR